MRVKIDQPLGIGLILPGQCQSTAVGGNGFSIGVDAGRGIAGLLPIAHRLRGQPGLLKVPRQLDRHFLCLLSIKLLQHIAHSLMPVAPLHLIQAMIEVSSEQRVPKAIVG